MIRTWASWEKKLTRQAYADALVELGGENPKVVVMDADLAQSTLTKFFAAKYPERFFDMGIAEQNMVATASGLALMGFVPFVSTYSMFVTGRAYDMVRNSVAYQKANVKIGAAHGGISVGKDGPTHQSMEDVSLMRTIPGMTVIVPCDCYETTRVTRFAAEHKGPVFIRMGREPVPVVTQPSDSFQLGKAMVLEEGTDGTIIACGLMVPIALEASDRLRAKGIRPRVLNMATIKPLDREAILAAAKETGAIVAAEEHNMYGGLGSAVCEVIAQSDHRVPVKIVAIQDRYLESGPMEDLLHLAGLTPDAIEEALVGLLTKRDGGKRA